MDVTTSGGCDTVASRRACLDPRVVLFSTLKHRLRGASVATPGQAGLPAEFKHINKRRKRNLQGFP